MLIIPPHPPPLPPRPRTMMHERRDERPKNKELHGVVKDAVSLNLPQKVLFRIPKSPKRLVRDAWMETRGPTSFGFWQPWLLRASVCKIVDLVRHRRLFCRPKTQTVDFCWGSDKKGGGLFFGLSMVGDVQGKTKNPRTKDPPQLIAIYFQGTSKIAPPHPKKKGKKKEETEKKQETKQKTQGSHLALYPVTPRLGPCRRLRPGAAR